MKYGDIKASGVSLAFETCETLVVLVLDMICLISFYLPRFRLLIFLLVDWFHKVVERLLAERQQPQAIISN